MAALRGFLGLLSGLLRFHKLKILLTMVASLMFAVWLFPYDDLADLFSAQVARATQNQVFIQFDDLGISFFPFLAVDLNAVEVDTPMLPTLTATNLRLAPSIAALLQFKTGFSATAEGLLGGELGLTAREGKRVSDDNPARELIIDATYAGLNLKQARELLSLPMALEGVANITLDATVDPTFTDQPQAETELNITKLRMPPSTVPTAFGPMALPNIQFSTVVAKARLVARDLVIEEAQLGDPNEPLNGRVKGQIAVDFRRSGMGVEPLLGAYDLRVELNVRKSMENELALFLGFLGKYKNPTLNGSRYAFRIRGVRFGAPPDIQPLATFQ